jgi:hypothetical protein
MLGRTGRSRSGRASAAPLDGRRAARRGTLGGSAEARTGQPPTPRAPCALSRARRDRDAAAPFRTAEVPPSITSHHGWKLASRLPTPCPPCIAKSGGAGEAGTSTRLVVMHFEMRRRAKVPFNRVIREGGDFSYPRGGARARAARRTGRARALTRGRCDQPAKRSFSARMWSGPVPQQPPTMLASCSLTHVTAASAYSSGLAA